MDQPTSEPNRGELLRDLVADADSPNPVPPDLVATFFTEDEMSEDEAVRVYLRFMGRPPKV